MSPAKRRRAFIQVQEQFAISERRACRLLAQPRSSQRYAQRQASDEEALAARIVALATRFGRYGYRRVTALLRREDWTVNHKRVERIWRREGLCVPQKQPKRGRLWLADGSLVRKRVEHRNHVWTYDFVFERTADGRPLRLLTVIDEYTRECLAIAVARRLTSVQVLELLADLFVRHGVPAHIRSDNGPEFTAEAVRKWLGRVGVETLFIEPGSPWENGYIESFNGKLRGECLNCERFDTLLEAQVVIEGWRREYNRTRPHSSLNYRSPAPEAWTPHYQPRPSIEVPVLS